MRPWTHVLVPAVLLLGGCAAVGGRETPPAVVDIGFGHVHGLDINTGDGAVYAATHTGIFRLDPNGPVRIADRYQDTMGFTATAPDKFLGSGHPDTREPGPVHIGLVRSADAARTWQPVSLQGEVDFHALTASGSTIHGWDARSGRLMRSDDDGATWQRGARAAISDIDVDPLDPLRLVVAAETVFQESGDGGVTLMASPVQPPRPLTLIDHVEYQGGDREPRLAGVDTDGGVWALDTGAWVAAGRLPSPAQAFTAIGPDRYVAATEAGVFASEDAGRTWRLVAESTP